MWEKKKSLQNTDTQCKRTFDVKKIYDVYYSRYKWLENGRGRYLKKKNAGGGESTIIQKHHLQNGKRILLRIAGHSDPSRRWVSNRYGNQPYLFQAHPSLWDLTQWLGTKKFPDCFPQKVLDSESLDFIHRSKSKVLEDRGTWFESLFSF